MRTFIKTIIRAVASLVAFVILPSLAHGYIEVNGFYFSDTLSTDSSASNNRMFLDLSVGFAIDKKAKYLAGWNYSMHSTSDATSTTTTYSSTQMGPRFIFFLDKENAWSLGVGYYLVTNATFDNGGGTSEKWKGTALKADIGYNMAVGTDSYVGVRFNYSSASYKERLIGDTGYSAVSYTKTAMYPSIYYIFVF